MKPTKPKASQFILGKWTAFSAATLGSITLLFATPQAAPTDEEEIAGFLRMNLQQDEQMEGAKVTVRLDHGIAALKGDARSLSQIERASAWAYGMKGVVTVVNQLEVKPAEPSAILDGAKAAFRDGKLIKATKVKVATNGSRVILSGKVSSWDESEIARDLISEIPGVTAIDNKITVDFEEIRTDAQIAEQLKFMVRNDPAYVGLALTPSVQDGVVTWRGNIGSNDELNRLVRHSYVTGAVEVVSHQIRIKSELQMEELDDKDYRADEVVEALTLAIKSDTRLNTSDINFSYEDGVITLKGRVSDVSQSDAAVLTAGTIPGVLRVSSQLKVANNQAIASSGR